MRELIRRLKNTWLALIGSDYRYLTMNKRIKSFSPEVWGSEEVEPTSRSKE